MTPAQEEESNKENGGRPSEGRRLPGVSSWIVPPAELCPLCRKPILTEGERSSWNGRPAHGECVRVHALQQHPTFRDWVENPLEEGEEQGDGVTRTDDDEDEGWSG